MQNKPYYYDEVRRCYRVVRETAPPNRRLAWKPAFITGTRMACSLIVKILIIAGVLYGVLHVLNYRIPIGTPSRSHPFGIEFDPSAL